MTGQAETLALAPFFADFADGRAALLQRVEVTLLAGDAQGPGLRIGTPGGETEFWHLQDLWELPDLSSPSLLVLATRGRAAARLFVDDREAMHILRRLAPGMRAVPGPAGLSARIGKLAAGALAAVALIVFGLVPAMSNQLALLLPPRGEQALGAATFEQIRNALGRSGAPVPICEGEAGRAALDAMTRRLLPEPDLPYPLDVQVLRHPMINAFALPGGKVILFEGLIRAAGSPEQVAGVLAHEIGHVAARDPTRLALRSAGSVGVLGLLFGDFAGGAVILLATEHLIRASYSRRAEADADAYALGLLAQAGLPSAPFADFFLSIAEEEPAERGLIAHFATHPDPLGRAEAARAADALAGNRFVPVLSAREWEALRRICR